MTDTLAQYCAVLLARWRWVVWGILLALLSTTIVLVLKPPMYRSEATVIVRTPGDVSRVQDGGDLFARARAGTYAALANSASVSSRVVANLGLNLAPEELAQRIHASHRVDTALLDISVSAPSADESQRITTILVSELEAMVRILEIMPGSVVPRAELVTVDPPHRPDLLVAWGVPVWAVSFGSALLGALLGAVGAVLRFGFEVEARPQDPVNPDKPAGLLFSATPKAYTRRGAGPFESRRTSQTSADGAHRVIGRHRRAHGSYREGPT